MATIKRKKRNKITSGGKDVEEVKPCAELGECKWYNFCEKQYGSSQKMKVRITYIFNNSTSGSIPKELKARS